MKNYIIYGLVALLSLASCNRDKQEPDLNNNFDRSLYEELELSINTESSLEDDALRSLHQVGEASITSRFGQDGETMLLPTKLIKVRTDGIHELLKHESHQWTISNNGRRLVLKAKILVLRDKLTDVKELILESIVDLRPSGRSILIPRSGIIEENILYHLSTKVKRTGTRNQLLINDSATPAKFRPQGRLEIIKVINNTANPITMTGITYTTEQVPIPSMSDTNSRFEYNPRVYKKSNRFVRRVNFLLETPAVVAPGQSERIALYVGTYAPHPDQVALEGGGRILLNANPSYASARNSAYFVAEYNG